MAGDHRYPVYLVTVCAEMLELFENFLICIWRDEPALGKIR